MGSATVTVGAVVVGAVIVLGVVVVVVVVVVGGRTETHTLSPARSGVLNDAPLIRSRRARGTLSRAANRVHDSFDDTRRVELHCGESVTLDATGAAASTALDTGIAPTSDANRSNADAVTWKRLRRRGNISANYLTCHGGGPRLDACLPGPDMSFEALHTFSPDQVEGR